MPGTIIGRISVKVTPDTSDFRDQTKQDLRKIEAQLADVTIGLKLDTFGLAAQAARPGLTPPSSAPAPRPPRARRDVQRQLHDVTVSVNLDNEGSLRTAITRLQRELDALDEVDIGVKLDRGELTTARDLLTEQFD